MGISTYNTPQRDQILTNAMQHRGQYIAGSYEQGDVVVDSEWVMCANKDTSDRAAPQPIGVEESPLEAWVPFDSSQFGVIASGQRYEFLEAGWIKELRIWIPAPATGNISYKVLMADVTDPDNPSYTSIETAPLTPDSWLAIRAMSQLVLPGHKILVVLQAQNKSSATTFDDGWTYQGVNNTEVSPGIESWNTNVQETLLRITDQGFDNIHTVQLGQIVGGSSLEFVSTQSSVNYKHYLATGPSVAYVGYHTVPVVVEAQSGVIDVGVDCAVHVSIPVPLATEYSLETNGWLTDPTWAAVTGILEVNGTPVDLQENNAFGIDLTFQPGVASPDWNLVSFNG